MFVQFTVQNGYSNDGEGNEAEMLMARNGFIWIEGEQYHWIRMNHQTLQPLIFLAYLQYLQLKSSECFYIALLKIEKNA